MGHGKDEPDISQKAMEYLGTTKANTVVFEDAYYAAKTARADGFITVAVYDPYEENQTELRSVSDLFIEDFKQKDSFWKFTYGI